MSTKVCLVKAMVFPVVMYRCQIWTIKHWALKKWCFWTVVLGKILDSPLDWSRSNQSILKEISPGCSLEGLMLKLKLQYFGHLIRRANSLEKTLMLERLKAGERDDIGWTGWMASQTQWTWVRVNSGSWWWAGKTGMLWLMGLQRSGHYWVIELNWIDHRCMGWFLHFLSCSIEVYI